MCVEIPRGLPFLTKEESVCVRAVGEKDRDIVNRRYGNRPRSSRQPDISECFTPH